MTSVNEALAVLDSSLAVLEALFTPVSEKTVAKRVIDYEVALTSLVTGVFNGSGTATTLANAMRGLIRRSAKPVYLEGMVEGGFKNEADAESEMDEGDAAQIESWIDDQLDHVDEFAQDTAATRKADDKTAAQQAILNRVGYWVAALETLGGRGRASAQANKPGTWQYGDTDHCPTCQRLNGERHRVKWFIQRGFIPQEPGSDTLDCHGYNCDCEVVDDDGNVILP